MGEFTLEQIYTTDMSEIKKMEVMMVELRTSKY